MHWCPENWLKPTKSEYNLTPCWSGWWLQVCWSDECSQKQWSCRSSGPPLDPLSGGSDVPSSQFHTVRFRWECSVPSPSRAGVFTIEWWNPVSHCSCTFCWCHWVHDGPPAEMTLSGRVWLCWCFPQRRYHLWIIREEKETLPCFEGLLLLLCLI